MRALAALILIGCGSSGGAPVDAGADFAIGPQVTHVGPKATTCCMVTNGAAQALYLANPVPSMPVHGRDQPANGELHLSDPFGVDITLAQNVPAFGYAFSPDGRWALYLTRTKTQRYALELAALEGPELRTPSTVTAEPDGMANARLFDQAFFTPSGRYLVLGVLPKGVQVSADLHVVEMGGGRDVFSLPNGAFDYLEQVTLDDTMVYANSTASTVPGVPSVEGLYMIHLAAAGHVTPALVDTHVTNFATTADGAKLIYVRSDGTMIMLGLQQNDLLTLATNVVAFTLGPSRRGPIVYTTGDGALHVRQILRPEAVTTVAGGVDLFSPIVFSPDNQHLYWFTNVDTQDGRGDLHHVPLPPHAPAPPSLVATRVSTRDFHFVGDRLILMSNVDATGATADVTVAALDGSGATVVARGAATGELLTALPAPSLPPPTGQISYGAQDMAPSVTPPVYAHLTGAVATPGYVAIDGSRSIVGALAFARADLTSGEQTLATGVKTGLFEFSDDGYALLYVDGVAFNRIANNWVGSLALFTTGVDIGAVTPKLDGVSELGPVVGRSLFVDAPMANPPGLYFVHY